MWIEVSVPKVIDSTASTSHNKSSCEEKGGCTDDGGWCSKGGRHSCSEECAEHARKEEVICADRVVQPHQLTIRNGFLRQVR